MFESLLTIYSLDLSSNRRLSIDGFEKASKGLENSSLAVLNISNIVAPFQFSSIIGKITFKYLKNTKLKVLVVENCRLVDINPLALYDLLEH